MFKKVLFSLGLLLISFAALAVPASAQEVRSGAVANVGKEEFIDSSLSSSATKLNIEGVVNGNVYCTSQDVVISGVVNGNVYCFAQNITVTGRIDGDLTSVALNTKISGIINGSITTTTSSLITTSTAKIRQDIIASASNATIDGLVARDVTISATTARVGATIGRDLMGNYGQLTLTDGAIIKGNVDYKSNNDLIKENNTNVEGNTSRASASTAGAAGGILSFALLFIGFLVSLLIVSMTLIVLFPSYFEKTYKEISNKTGSTIGWGLFNLLVLPFVIALITVTVIGLPLAGLIVVVWVLSLMLSGPVFAYYIGKRITKKASPIKTMLVGSLVVLSLYALPVINIIVASIVAIVGSGAVLNLFKTSNIKLKK